MDNKRLPHYALSLRLKPSIYRILEEASKKTGLSKTAVIVVAIREYAKKEGISVEDEAETGD